LVEAVRNRDFAQITRIEEEAESEIYAYESEVLEESDVFGSVRKPSSNENSEKAYQINNIFHGNSPKLIQEEKIDPFD